MRLEANFTFNTMDNYNRTDISFLKKIGFFFAVFFVCFFITATIYSILMQKYGAVNGVILAQVALQNLLSFAAPALIVAAFISRKPLRYLGLNVCPKGKQLLFVCLVYVATIPMMNLLVELNYAVTFPDSLKPVEELLRQYEQAAQAVTDQLIKGQSVAGVLLLVLVIGCLTGFGEEIFFRGMLTKMFVDCPMNRHIAIWLGALIFSLMHFQFFGFVPRLLMGAMFGYFLVWTGSLWVPIFAHALNNSMVVVSNYAMEQGLLSRSIDEYGTTDCCLWLSIVSVAAFVALIKYRSVFIK